MAMRSSPQIVNLSLPLIPDDESQEFGLGFVVRPLPALTGTANPLLPRSCCSRPFSASGVILSPRYISDDPQESRQRPTSRPQCPVNRVSKAKPFPRTQPRLHDGILRLLRVCVSFAHCFPVSSCSLVRSTCLALCGSASMLGVVSDRQQRRESLHISPYQKSEDHTKGVRSHMNPLSDKAFRKTVSEHLLALRQQHQNDHSFHLSLWELDRLMSNITHSQRAANRTIRQHLAMEMFICHVLVIAVGTLSLIIDEVN